MKVQFQEGLKQSKRTEFAQLPARLAEKTALVAKKFADSELYLACIDESMTTRIEFSVSLPSNRRLAYLGDAFLSFQLAQQAFTKDLNPDEFQKWRSACLSNERLAKVYDALFPGEDVVLHFNDVLSDRQKATFIEALAGLLQTEEIVNLIIQ